MPSGQRTLLLAAAGVVLLGGMVLSHVLSFALDLAGQRDPLILGGLQGSMVAGYGAALVSSGLLWRPGRLRRFMVEMGEELARVSWPSREQTSHATWVVAVAVAICTVFLGILDGFWLWLSNWVLGAAA